MAIGRTPMFFTGTATPASVVTTVFAGADNGTANSPVNFTTTAAVVVGNLVVLMYEYESNSATSSPLASSVTIGGNSMTRIATCPNMNASRGSEMWYIENCPAVSSSSTIVVTPSVGTSFKMECVCAQATSILTASSLDKSVTSTATTTTPTATTATLTQAAELCFAGMGLASGSTSFTEAAGWTTISQNVGNTTNAVGFAYKEVSATTAVTYAPTMGASTQCGEIIATFKKA